MSVITPIDAPTDYYPANLLSLEELKSMLRLDPDDRTDDEFYQAAIAAASAAIARYTERNFGIPTVTEERQFQYDGEGTLDIDDCTRITAVALVVPGASDLPVPSDSWAAQPPIRFESPVNYYILLPTLGSWPAVSPAMGFTRNLDVYARERGLAQLPQIVKVTATWGWPEVPVDVKWAAAWTVDEWQSRVDTSEGMTSEAIVDFSRSWGRNNTIGQQAFAIPQRARDLLASFERHYA